MLDVNSRSILTVLR